MRIAVVGGGVAGLSSALMLARAGHEVILLERDFVDEPASPDAAFDQARRGVAHFRQPHAFIPRAVAVLKRALPDVHAALVAAGADEIDISTRLPGQRRPSDRELVYLGVRRALIEWALRHAVRRQQGLTVQAGARAVGWTIVAAGSDGRARIDGVRLDDGTTIAAELVVDAQGRTSRSHGWLAAHGIDVAVKSAPSGVLYYSRYFRFHDGSRFPDGPWMLTPRGDFGYAAFTTFPGDNGTFAVAFAIDASDHPLRGLQHESAYEAVCRATPLLATLMDRSQPITGVFPMGELHNTLHRFFDGGRAAAHGLIPVGDALVHTDPMFALGLAFAVVHADALTAAVGAHATDLAALADDFGRRCREEAEERFAMACATDEARSCSWRGEAIDFTRPDGCYPLFALIAGGAVAMMDPEVFRVVARRNGFLDRLAVLDDDAAMQRRIAELFAALRARTQAAGAPARSGPSHREMVELVAAAR